MNLGHALQKHTYEGTDSCNPGNSMVPKNGSDIKCLASKIHCNAAHKRKRLKLKSALRFCQRAWWIEGKPFVRLLKHQLLKHQLQKHRLLAPNHQLSTTSTFYNIDCLKHRLAKPVVLNLFKAATPLTQNFFCHIFS